MDFNRHVLPFYMTYPMYPMPPEYREEDTVMRDLEYLQQMYPKDAKRYQQRISEILDKIDYQGSLIYDEYPDRWQLYGIADNILAILKQEAKEEALENKDAPPITEEKWEWISDMIQILLFYEIYKRRHRGKKGYLKF